MKKNTVPTHLIACLVLIATTLFSNKSPNYPKGFSPKNNTSLVFTENKGQVHDQDYKSRPDVLFSGSDGNLTFHLKNNGISYQLFRVDTWKKENDVIKNPSEPKKQKDDEKLVADQSTIYRLDINWLNANTNTEIKKQNPLAGFNNYYLENCPDGALNVKSYQQILYQNLYSGIDLKWYEKNGHLEYDYLVSAGADYKKIQLEVKGADKISINKKGELIYKTLLGNIIEQAPLVKQNGKTLKSKWIITNNVLSFEIENLDNNEAFIIDPVVRMWGTYYGGPGDEYGYSCATDASGNVYMTGFSQTNSGTIIATSGSHQFTFGGGSLQNPLDAFLVKFNSAGIRQWSTYYGSADEECGHSCAIDAGGNVYMAGISWRLSNLITSIATSGSHQSAHAGGGCDAFLVKFNSAGIRQWCTYYGDTGDDKGYSCSTDATGNVYLAGLTSSQSGTSIATTGSHQSTLTSGQAFDAFLVKFNSAGIRQWGTYYGGSGNEGNGAWGSYNTACATDATGNIYMSGYTDTNSGTNIATPGSHQSSYGGGTWDAYLVKFNSAGIRQWGTYYGGAGYDIVMGSCATDASGNVYMTGITSTSAGTGIGSSGSHQSTYAGGSLDAFLVKFNPAGIRQWGTYYGGAVDDWGLSCATDPSGNVYISGLTTTNSGTNIASIGSYQSGYGGGSYDAFLSKFNSAGTLQWGTYYGGVNHDVSRSCAADANGNVYISGETITNSGTNIANSNSHQPFHGGGNYDAFLVKLYDNCLNQTITVNSGSICAGQSFTIVPTGASNYTYSSGSAIVTPSVNTSYSVIGTSTSGCAASNIAISTVTVNAKPFLTINSGSICLGKSFTLMPSGASTYTYSSGSNVVSPLINTSYSVTGTSTSGCVGSNTAVSTVTVNASPTLSVNSGGICAGQSFTMFPSGAATYTYSSGSNIVTPGSSSSYSVYGIALNGCQGINPAISSVTVNALPNINIAGNNEICLGETTKIKATGASSYTWNTGATSASISVQPTSTIIYTVTGMDQTNCTKSQTIEITVSPCTTLAESIEKQVIRFYPNPNLGKFVLELPDFHQSRITIYNYLGQLIYEGAAEDQMQIDLSTHANGMYTLLINKSNKELKTIKIIKQ